MAADTQISPRRILTEAKALIVNSDNWCQGEMERRHMFTSSGGTQYCARGAIYKVTRDDEDAYEAREVAERLLREAAKEIMNADLATPVIVNDELGHDAVMRMFDIAIVNSDD